LEYSPKLDARYRANGETDVATFGVANITG
jgi:hypothetical protein